MKNLICRVVLSAVLMGNIATVIHNLATPRPAVEQVVLKAPIVQYLLAYIQYIAAGGGGSPPWPKPAPPSN